MKSHGEAIGGVVRHILVPVGIRQTPTRSTRILAEKVGGVSCSRNPWPVLAEKRRDVGDARPRIENAHPGDPGRSAAARDSVPVVPGADAPTENDPVVDRDRAVRAAVVRERARLYPVAGLAAVGVEQYTAGVGVRRPWRSRGPFRRVGGQPVALADHAPPQPPRTAPEIEGYDRAGALPDWLAWPCGPTPRFPESDVIRPFTCGCRPVPARSSRDHRDRRVMPLPVANTRLGLKTCGGGGGRRAVVTAAGDRGSGGRGKAGRASSTADAVTYVAGHSRSFSYRGLLLGCPHLLTLPRAGSRYRLATEHGPVSQTQGRRRAHATHREPNPRCGPSMAASHRDRE